VFKKQQGKRIEDMTKEMDADNELTQFIDDVAENFDSSDVQITFVPEPVLDTADVQIQFVDRYNPRDDGDFEPVVKQKLMDPSVAILASFESMGQKAEQAIYEETEEGAAEKQQRLAQKKE
jgi:hypothetical protein